MAKKSSPPLTTNPIRATSVTRPMMMPAAQGAMITPTVSPITRLPITPSRAAPNLFKRNEGTAISNAPNMLAAIRIMMTLIATTNQGLANMNPHCRPARLDNRPNSAKERAMPNR
ncbi:MAG: hypothetical protein BWY83_00750 [bacterium ADurb.Bin478]|nr:MAG: hypothetical protein BWY83_00750 [bacterium ADurb.Bin478]